MSTMVRTTDEVTENLKSTSVRASIDRRSALTYFGLQNLILFGVPLLCFYLLHTVLLNGPSSFRLYGTYDGYFSMFGGRILIDLVSDHTWQDTLFIQTTFVLCKLLLFNLIFLLVFAKGKYMRMSVAVNAAVALWSAIYVMVVVLIMA